MSPHCTEGFKDDSIRIPSVKTFRPGLGPRTVRKCILIGPALQEANVTSRRGAWREAWKDFNVAIY